MAAVDWASKRSLRVEDYTVGWICALPVELAAAHAMLDEEHARPYTGGVSDRDLDRYEFGRMGNHNIVIAFLASGTMGTNAAAHCATRMTSIFKEIRFQLMVGVGGAGGDPLGKDLRLGDVVVAVPLMGNPGVVQYDFGKTGQGGEIQQSGFLNMAPVELRLALTRFRALCQLGRSNPTQHLDRFKDHAEFSNGALKDVLFDAAFDHLKGEADCEKCEGYKRSHIRSSRKNIKIHYGTIASGNQVIKDGITREKISSSIKGGALCFEMEAAGLMNDHATLNFRGICDYADSHKNKAWQPYAAATAAACAKEFLAAVPTISAVRLSSSTLSTLTFWVMANTS
ncbi:purine and uridine phosphorylase [Ascobolus immersus RN42]|uniref:Purine and uridine phosphorylase n=1 Tax=Ascobolus immersus RN42 TaxID=1160509 RepID=A0A3N4HEJ6_ASCIM|nr:purine and uridine phosphorylase [Ascobolus immersus RN42]